MFNFLILQVAICEAITPKIKIVPNAITKFNGFKTTG
jgi:hypothetical protein